MLEIPTYQNVDSLDRRSRDMPSIFQVSSAYDSGSEILMSKLRRVRVEDHFFEPALGHPLKDLADLGRCPFELGKGEVRENERIQARPESIEELGRVQAELVIQTAPDHRGICVDPAPHRLLLYAIQSGRETRLA